VLLERDAWLRLVAVVELLPGVLDAQLRTEAGLMPFEYFVLAMLSEASERTLRMTSLALRTAPSWIHSPTNRSRSCETSAKRC
jgi:hypothetical protein